jgi:23S rRNA (cytosine1962-C5)-methyltransferase
VYAACAGASHSTTVDLSTTYQAWTARNFALNGIDARRHTLVRADVLAWLGDEISIAEKYDLIVLDPPSFSNSKKMQGVLDVQRDHVRLVDDCMQLLAPGGLLLFSNNAQRFQMDAELAERYLVTDISAATIPFDFQGNPRIHRCFEVRHRPV